MGNSHNKDVRRFRELYDKHKAGSLSPLEHVEFIELQTHTLPRYYQRFEQVTRELGIDQLLEGDEVVGEDFRRLAASNARHSKKNRYTHEGLPIVSYDTIEALKALLVRDIQHSEAYSKNLKELVDLLPKNPAVLGGIMRFSHSFIDSKNYENADDTQSFYRSGMSLGILAGGLIVYQALKRQAEANKLEERLKE